jgi:hypothetical protein
MLTLFADPKWMWYLNRGSGVVLLVVWTVAILIGQLASIRAVRTRFAWIELHRNLTVIGLAVLVVHVASCVADDYVDIDVTDVLVPFRSPYEPLWLGLGVLSIDLAVAIMITTLLRYRAPRMWAVVHRAAYVLWPLAVVHGVGIGTDSAGTVVPLTVGCVVAVVAGTALRLMSATKRSGPVHPSYRVLADGDQEATMTGPPTVVDGRWDG